MTSESNSAQGTAWKRLVACIAVVAVLVALDLWSKRAVFEWIEEIQDSLPRDAHGHPRYAVVGEWLTLMLNMNYGAAFGHLDSIPYVLVSGRVLAAILLTWLILRAPRGKGLYLTSLVLILSGALGNLYDNLFQPIPAREGAPFGPVRDFIDVYFAKWDWHFPTFNVADSCITVGAAFLLLSGFGASQPQEQGTGESGDADPSQGGSGSENIAALEASDGGR